MSDLDGSQDSFNFEAPERKDTTRKSKESDIKSMNNEQDVSSNIIIL